MRMVESKHPKVANLVRRSFQSRASSRQPGQARMDSAEDIVVGRTTAATAGDW